MNDPGRRYRVNEEAIVRANEQVKEEIEAERKLGAVFFSYR